MEFRTDPNGFLPYARDEQTLARPWAIPGTPGLEHRLGGITGENLTGNISYSPANHELMIRIRARKVAGIAQEIPPTEVFGDPVFAAAVKRSKERGQDIEDTIKFIKEGEQATVKFETRDGKRVARVITAGVAPAQVTPQRGDRLGEVMKLIEGVLQQLRDRH